jgi:hypothetical protein
VRISLFTVEMGWTIKVSPSMFTDEELIKVGGIARMPSHVKKLRVSRIYRHPLFYGMR